MNINYGPGQQWQNKVDHLWGELTVLAKERRTIPHEKLANKLAVSPQQLDLYSTQILDYCRQNQCPSLIALIIHQHHSDLASWERAKVFEFDWLNIHQPGKKRQLQATH